MRVLVTGGSGFVGRHVVEALQARGDEVRVVDLQPYPTPDVDCLVGDLRDPEVIARAFGADVEAVVHLAASTSVLQSMNDPAGVYENNVTVSAHLLERARVQGVSRFVFASTNAVVGDVGEQVINEQSPLAPLTAYGATKAAVEMLCSAYRASYAMSPVALRFTNIYGVGMQTKDSVVARLMRAALSGEGISIYGDGEQLRDYLYVKDATDAIVLGLGLGESTTLCIGGGRSVSMNELHHLATQATGRDIPATHVPAKPGEMPAVIVDLSRAKAAGFVPKTSVLEGLRATWEDFSVRAAAEGA